LGRPARLSPVSPPAGSAYNSDGKGLPFYQEKKEFESKYIGPPTTWTTEVTKRAKANDILMSVRAPVGPINFSTQEICIGRGLAAIRAKAGLDQNFLFYFLLSAQSQIGGRDGAVFPSISRKEICSIRLPIPQPLEQQRIVAILDDALARLATAAANTEKNLKNARELFGGYVESIFADARRDWPSRKIGDVAKLARGHNPPKSKFSPFPKDGYVRFYQIRDGKTDNYAVYVPDTPQLHKVERDEILMVAYRHVGRAFRGVSGAFNVALCKITNKDRSMLNDDFLFYVIPTRLVRGELLKRAERSLIPSMSVEHLRQIAIPVPPIREQERAVAEIRRLEEAVSLVETMYRRKLDALEKLKQSILKKAFAGELVSPPSQAIKEAAE
jgi:type I restriction enzyme S subunit